MKLKAFSKFENTSEALSAATLLIDSKPSKGLRKFLRAHCDGETLAVADSKLGNSIKEKLVSWYTRIIWFHFVVFFLFGPFMGFSDFAPILFVKLAHVQRISKNYVKTSQRIMLTKLDIAPQFTWYIEIPLHARDKFKWLLKTGGMSIFALRARGKSQKRACFY